MKRRWKHFWTERLFIFSHAEGFAFFSMVCSITVIVLYWLGVWVGLIHTAE